MLDLAISIDTDRESTMIIETNCGVKLRAPEWPHDCDFQLVAFDASGNSCDVVSVEGLAEDIGRALMMIDRAALLKGEKPDWYRRLKLYSM
jgi:hypothetical protein